MGPIRRSLLAASALAVTACGTMIHEYMAFGRADVVPGAVDASVGDVISFELRPPVSSGSKWEIECGGPARFVDTPAEDFKFWVAGTDPLKFEAIVAPWDRRMAGGGNEAWVTYGIPGETELAPLDKPLPIRRAPFREIAPVTFSTSFSVGSRAEPIAVERKNDRVYVKYLTPIEPGVPHSPYVRSMLLETGGRKILYAEVLTNFGSRGGKHIGYEVDLSYSSRVEGTVELALVEWVGYGDYYGPFAVHRSPNLDAPSPSAAPPAEGPPKDSSAPGSSPSDAPGARPL